MILPGNYSHLSLHGTIVQNAEARHIHTSLKNNYEEMPDVRFRDCDQVLPCIETLTGWDGCSAYVAPGASFAAQCEPLVDVKTVQAYCDWMAGLGKGPLKGCSYKLNSSSYDEETRTAMFFGTFTATHVGEGGPIAPTNKQTNTDYVYALTMNAGGKIEKMCKIWNAPWALKELGWA